MENKPGNGSTSPFGDEDGATVAGGGASSGAHDFTTDPKSNAPTTGGRDFTKESRPQQSGQAQDLNPDDQAPGGRLPFAQTDAVAAARKDASTDVVPGHKCFNVGGGGEGG